MSPKIVAVGFAAAAIMSLAACGADSKFTEQYQDAPVSGRDDSAAVIINMPDGFANIATKCYNGDRIYVIRDGSSAVRGGIAIHADDPSCS